MKTQVQKTEMEIKDFLPLEIKNVEHIKGGTVGEEDIIDG